MMAPSAFHHTRSILLVFASCLALATSCSVTSSADRIEDTCALTVDHKLIRPPQMLQTWLLNNNNATIPSSTLALRPGHPCPMLFQLFKARNTVQKGGFIFLPSFANLTESHSAERFAPGLCNITLDDKDYTDARTELNESAIGKYVCTAVSIYDFNYGDTYTRILECFRVILDTATTEAPTARDNVQSEGSIGSRSSSTTGSSSASNLGTSSAAQVLIATVAVLWIMA